MTPAEILNGAADLLETDGWTQGDFEESVLDGQGNFHTLHCAVGAINKVATGRSHFLASTNSDVERSEALMILSNQINLPYDEHFDLVGWNDSLMPNQASEVIHQFRLAAKVASGE